MNKPFFCVAFAAIACTPAIELDPSPLIDGKLANPIALYDLASGNMPFPNDLVRYSPETGKFDADIALPGIPTEFVQLLEAQAGFSANPRVILPFSQAITATNLNVEMIRQVDQVKIPITWYVGPATNQISVLALSALSEGEYAVYLGDGALALNGDTAAIADDDFLLLSGAEPLTNSAGKSQIDGLPDQAAAALEPLRAQTNKAIAAAPSSVANVISAFIFSPGDVTGDIVALGREVFSWPASASVSMSQSAPASAVYETGGSANPLYAVPHSNISIVVNGTFASGDIVWSAGGAYAGLRPAKRNFLLFLPVLNNTANQPVDVVLHVHGIGRSAKDTYLLADAVNKVGLALLAFDLPLHGDRTGDVDYDNDGTVASGEGFFSPSEIAAFRANLLQSSADIVMAWRAAEKLVNLDLYPFTPTPSYGDGEPDLSGEVSGAIAYSLGAWPLALAQTMGLRGERFVFNAAGAGFRAWLNSSSALLAELKPLLDALPGDETDAVKIATALDFVQWSLDPVDPVNHQLHNAVFQIIQDDPFFGNEAAAMLARSATDSTAYKFSNRNAIFALYSPFGPSGTEDFIAEWTSMQRQAAQFLATGNHVIEDNKGILVTP